MRHGLFLLLLTAVSGCKPIPASRDVHESPTSVIQAMFQGLKDDNTELILDTFSPAVREKVRTEMRKGSATAAVDQHMQMQWGVTLANLDTQRITLKIDEDLGSKKHVDAQLEGKSYRDQATVVEIEGRWYIEQF